MHEISRQGDPYADSLWEKRQQVEAERKIKHAAWIEGWRAGSRIGAAPINPYAA